MSVGIVVLVSEAVGVHCSVHRPGVDFDQRKVLVDEAHHALVMVERGRKQLFVHAGAVGALKVVVVDDGHLGMALPRTADGRASRWTADPC